MEYSFFMPMIPPKVTHQEKKITVNKKTGKPQVYEPAELKAARAKLEAHLAQHIPKALARGAVRLVVKWCFPVTEGHEAGDYMTVKPDTDNLQKLLKDVMTKLKYWKDDAQVASEISEKFYAQFPGIFIQITDDLNKKGEKI